MSGKKIMQKPRPLQSNCTAAESRVYITEPTKNITSLKVLKYKWLNCWWIPQDCKSYGAGAAGGAPVIIDKPTVPSNQELLKKKEKTPKIKATMPSTNSSN